MKPSRSIPERLGFLRMTHVVSNPIKHDKKRKQIRNYLSAKNFPAPADRSV